MSVGLHVSKTSRPNFTKSSAVLTVAMARSFSVDSGICCILVVLWTTSCFHMIVQAKATPIWRMPK